MDENETLAPPETASLGRSREEAAALALAQQRALQSQQE